MAIGTISTPAAWYNGTVFTPTWGQSVQDTVNDLYSRLSLSANISSRTAPTSALTAGVVYRDAIPLAWAFVVNSGAASLNRGMNISSLSRSGTGVVVVNLVTAVSGGTIDMPVMATLCSTSAASDGRIVTQPNSTSQVTVTTYNGAGALTDRDFAVVVYGPR